jgi:cyclase
MYVDGFPMRWLIAFCAALAFPAAAQQDLSKVEITAQKLSDSVYLLTGAGGNIGLSAGNDAVFIVDDQFAPLTPKIQAAIAKITPKPVGFVLNTHWHFDHTGGNENFGKAGAVILAHENVRKRMSVESFIEFLGMKFKAEPREALPVVTFTRDVSLHLNGEEIRALHVPNAHTDGDAIVHFVQANTIHMGDNFFKDVYPFIDLSSGGSFEGVIRAADIALGYTNDSTRIIPGHGAMANRADLKKYRDVLVQVRDRVAALIRQGKTREEVIAAKPTSEWDATWGAGFMKTDVFLGIVYQSLKR